MYTSRRGFTLIELLVVIAIIAILAAILFPVFARARAKARQTQCLSNMKQLGLAMIAYATDYDQFLPVWGPATDPGDPSKFDPGNPPAYTTWDTAIEPYTKNKQILICPDNPLGTNGTARGYSEPRYVSGVGTEQPPSPSDTVMLAEKGSYPPGAWADAAMETFYQMGWNTVYPKDIQKMPHNEGKNFAFVDGHVKWSKVGAGPFASNPGGNGAGACEVTADWPTGS